MLDNFLLKKIDKALSYRFLVGDINFSDEEKEAIRDEFFSIYSAHSKNNWGSNLTKQELDILSITLILVAKNYPKDWRGKEFWPKIADRLNIYSNDLEIVMPLPYPVLSQIKDRLTDPTRSRVFFTNSQGHQQYRLSFMFQAYAPKTSIEAFIKLVWTLYCSVFSFSYDDKEDSALCSEIIDKLAKKNDRNSDLDDDVQIGGSLYQIRAALKYGFAQDPESSTLLLRRILDYINKIYSEKKDLALKAEEDYLAGLVESTIRGLLTPSLRKKRNKRSLPTVSKANEISANFLVNDSGKLELVTNSVRLDESFVGTQESILEVYPVLNGRVLGKPIRCAHPIVSSDFMPMIEEMRVPIEPLLHTPSDKICLYAVLKIDGKTFYETNIKRQFILVKGKREIIGDCRPDSYMVYFTDRFDTDKCLKIKDGFDKTERNLASFISSPGDSIVTKEQTLFFRNSSSEVNYSFGPGTIDTGMTACIKEKGKEEIAYSVFQKIDFLVISADKTDALSKIQVELVSERSASYLEILGSERLDSGGKTIDLSNLEPEKRYTIKLSKIDKNGKVTLICEPIRFIVSPDAEYSFQNPKTLIPCDDISLKMRWNFACYTGLENVKEGGKTTVVDFASHDFSDPDNHRIEFKRKRHDDNFLKEDEELRLVFKAPYFQWAIDEDELALRHSDSVVWYGDIYNNELIHAESSEKFKLFANDVPLLPAKKKGYFQLSNAFYNQKNVGDCLIRAEIYSDDNVQSIPLFTIIRHPKFYLENGIEDLFDETNEGVKLLFSNCYRGPADTEFRIVLEPLHMTNKIIEFKGNYCETDDFPTLERIPDNEYRLTIFGEYAEPNSITKRTVVLLREEDVLFGSENGFLYDGVSSLQFKKYRCPNGVQQKFKKNPVSISDIHYVEDDELPVYSGKLRIGKNKPLNVFFKSKRDDNILLYYEKDGDLKPMSCTSDGSDFVACDPDGKKYYMSHSIYCEAK